MGGIIGKSYSSHQCCVVLTYRDLICRLTLAPNFNVVGEYTETLELLSFKGQRRSSGSVIFNIEIWGKEGEGAKTFDDGTGSTSE